MFAKLHKTVCRESLSALFAPASVAVIGASADPEKIGHAVLKNIVESGYTGSLHAVNPKGGTILDIEAVAQVSALPHDAEHPLDLAVICIPPRFVLRTMRELTELPVKAVIVITAGFKEVGRSGYRLEEEMAELARDNDIALLGPNCLGLINTAVPLNATFAANTPQKGNIAFFSQSGALCVAILDWAVGNNIGFSSFVSLGNKAVVDESHILEYLADDPETAVILGYVESIEQGRRFMDVARKMSIEKPVLLIKSGTTSAGARAASSHTGAIAGSDSAYTAAFRQCGVLRVKDIASLFTFAQAFASQPLPKGPNLAIVTNSGGPGILAADATESSRLIMATLTPETVAKLTAFLPSYAAIYNPIDIIGDADVTRYEKTLTAVAEDENVHSVLAMLSPTASVDVPGVAEAIIRVARTSQKPFFAAFLGEQVVGPSKRRLNQAGIPCYAFPEPAIAALEAMHGQAERAASPAPREVCIPRDIERARQTIQAARERNEDELVEFQAQEILKAYNLALPETELARTSDEAAAAAEAMGYPVVLKIASPQISHKTDVGGVAVNLKSAEAVRKSFTEITSRASRMRKDAYITGCLVQKMAEKGSKELIIGLTRDAQFGPLIMFGLGGVYVEVLKDVSFRLAPLTLEDAATMVREIKSFPLLRGVRGEPSVDFAAIEQVLLTMSQLALDFPEIQEAEFNPVLVSEHGALVADVRLYLGAPENQLPGTENNPAD